MSDTTASSSDELGDVSDLDAADDAEVDGEVIDISQNEGPELTTGVDDVDSGAATGDDAADEAVGDRFFGSDTGGSSTGATVGRGPGGVEPDDAA